MASSFEDRVVLITGASSGIGRALALELARRGAHLGLAARRADRLESLRAEIEALGRRAVAVACDVTRDGDLEAAVARIGEDLGKVDVAVANAGFGIAGRIDDLSVEDVRRQFETNVFGVLRTFHATRRDLEATRGRFAIVGSVLSHVSLPTTGPYAMSKHAVRALAETLRAEMRSRGVSVTLLSPGFVATEIRQVDNRGIHDDRRRDPIPAWLVMSAERCARVCARAIARRRREVVVTGHGKAIVWLARRAPWLVATLVERFAPSGRPAHRA